MRTSDKLLQPENYWTSSTMEHRIFLSKCVPQRSTQRSMPCWQRIEDGTISITSLCRQSSFKDWWANSATFQMA